MVAIAILVASLVNLQADDPTATNFASLLKFIQPDAKEQAYKEISWRNEFWPAVLEAKRLGRPILFWTMNGHPLGCT